jgi:hypothetical protein
MLDELLDLFEGPDRDRRRGDPNQKQGRFARLRQKLSTAIGGDDDDHRERRRDYDPDDRRRYDDDDDDRYDGRRRKRERDFDLFDF